MAMERRKLMSERGIRSLKDACGVRKSREGCWVYRRRVQAEGLVQSTGTIQPLNDFKQEVACSDLLKSRWDPVGGMEMPQHG